MKRLILIIIAQILLTSLGLSQFFTQNRYIVYSNHIIDTRTLKAVYDMPDTIQLTHSSYAPPRLYVSDSTNVYVFNVNNDSIYYNTTLNLQPAHSDFRLFTLYNSPSTTTCYAAAQIRTNRLKIFKILNTTTSGTVEYSDYQLGPVFPISDSLGCITMTQIQTGMTTNLIIRYLILDKNGIIKDTSQTFSLSGFWSSVQIIKSFLSSKLGYFGIITNENKIVLFKTIFNPDNDAPNQLTFTGSPTDIVFSPNGRFMYYTLPDGVYRYVFQQDTSFKIVNATDIFNLESVNANIWLLHNTQAKIDIIFNPNADTNNVCYKPDIITFAEDTTLGILLQQYPNTFFDFSFKIINLDPPILEFTLDSTYITKTYFQWQEPDFIVWTLNDSIIFDTTFQGHNHLVQTFTYMSPGENKFSATAYFINNYDTLTQTTHHFINLTAYQLTDLLEDTLIISCDTPTYYFDLSSFITGYDSIVWYVNGQRIDSMFNVSSGTLKSPGNFHVYVYYPGLTIEDSIKLLYQNTTFTKNQIKIFVNGQEYDPSNNTFCTQSGTINFNISLPDSSLCSNNFIYHYFFGDGSNLKVLNPQIDHKYTQPGDYLVTILIQNQDTRYTYAFHLPITVSINPIDSTPGFLNLNINQSVTLQIGKDFKINSYTWKKRNFFIKNIDTTIYNTASFLMNITDSIYQNENQLKAIFVDISSDNAQNIDIVLKNSASDTLTVKRFYTLPYTYKIFFGLPKIHKPNLTTWLTPESYYTYLWTNTATLTLRQILTSSTNTPIYHKYEKYMQDNALLDIPHFWLNYTALRAFRQLTFENPVGNRLGINIAIDSSVDHSHVSISQMGIIFNPHFLPSNLDFNWSSTATILDQTDSTITIAAAYPNKYELTLSVTDQFGCKYKSTVDLYVIDSLMARIPNAFTPNGDGINDTWNLQQVFLKQITSNPPIPVAVTIWNKNGKIVKRFLVNDEPQWNGTDNYGRKLPPGPYWYVIIINKKIVSKGTVTIVY